MTKTSEPIVTRSELALLNVLKSPVWSFDIDQMQMWWANRAALSLWNASNVEELISRDWSHISDSTRTRFQTYIQQFKQGTTVVEQWTFYPKQQSVLVRCACSNIQIKTERQAMLVEGVTDTMNRIDAETLRSIEAIRHTTAIISLYTLEYTPVMQNPAAIHCYGDEKNALETTANTFYKRFVDSNVVEQAMTCITAGEVFSIEAQVNTLNGTRWHGIDVRRTNDPVNGQPLILINEREITDRKQVEEQLQKYATQLQQVLTFEAMLKRITDKVRDSFDESQILQTAVRELALVTKVSCCNTALYNLEQGISTIYHEYADSGLGVQACVIQIAVFSDIYQQLLQGQYCQFCSINPSSLHGRAAMLACPIFDDQGVIGDLWLVNQQEHTFNDLEIRLVQQVANQCAIALRQTRLYQASLTQVAELEKLNHLKDDFLSTVSHELRTPVSNMKMGIHMLLLALNEPNLEAKKVARYLQILQEECNREIDLINDLLDLQRLDAGSQTIAIEAIQLQEWLPQILKLFQQQTHHRQQTLQVHLPSNLPLLISDSISLKRIIVELLNNAYKYTPAGEKILVTACVSSDKIQIAVSNFGIEIPVNELPRIFEKFYRIPSIDPWKQGGTGLGLALTQSLVKQLRGTIQVTSNAGQTIFTLELPMAPYLDCKIKPENS